MGILSDIGKAVGKGLTATHLTNLRKKRRDRYHRIKGQRTYQVIAEGDSWYNFPSNGKEDVVYAMTSEDIGCAVYTFADHGDTIAQIVGQIRSKRKKWRKRVVKDGVDLVMISGGGNDLFEKTGKKKEPSFYEILSPAPEGPDEAAWEPCINEKKLDEVIARIRQSYEAVIGEVQSIQPGKALPIFAHGYGYPVPTGKGYVAKVSDVVTLRKGKGWIRPVFIARGYKDKPQRQQAVLRKVIDDFNDMLSDLEKNHQGTLYYVDLRSVIEPGDWRDELHLKPPACRNVALEFKKRIEEAVVV